MEFSNERITELTLELARIPRHERTERRRAKHELKQTTGIANFIRQLSSTPELVEALYIIVDSSRQKERIENEVVARFIDGYKKDGFGWDGEDIRDDMKEFKEQCQDGALGYSPDYDEKAKCWIHDEQAAQDELKHQWAGNREDQAQALSHIHPQTVASIWKPLYALTSIEKSRDRGEDAPYPTVSSSAESFLAMCELPMPKEHRFNSRRCRGQMKIIRKSQQS